MFDGIVFFGCSSLQHLIRKLTVQKAVKWFCKMQEGEAA